MRIIGGRLKGRRLTGVKGQIRPTADRVREAIFNILGPEVNDSLVLDLFAGTGALGIEALSRGAGKAVFVEKHPSALQVLRRNLEQCGLNEVSRVMPLATEKAMPKLVAAGEHFSLIFLDPPYGHGLAAANLLLLSKTNLLAPGGHVVVEHSRLEGLAEAYLHLKRNDQRRYGATMVSFYICGHQEISDVPEV